ncbi:MAG: hypothetical protein KME55_34860, partial [Nostoc indistinguendum CM1-VF10]|nr:hypothetical protein [Nostoc indistinguendum CM1-VF10]
MTSNTQFLSAIVNLCRGHSSKSLRNHLFRTAIAKRYLKADRDLACCISTIDHAAHTQLRTITMGAEPVPLSPSRVTLYCRTEQLVY